MNKSFFTIACGMMTGLKKGWYVGVLVNVYISQIKHTIFHWRSLVFEFIMEVDKSFKCK